MITPELASDYVRYFFSVNPALSAERRRMERFNLRLPAKIEVLVPERKSILNLVTNNISGDGVHFHMLNPIPNDTSVRVTITMESEFVKKITGFHMILALEGRVIRSEKTGMAILFGKNQKVTRIML